MWNFDDIENTGNDFDNLEYIDSISQRKIYCAECRGEVIDGFCVECGEYQDSIN